MRSLSEAPKYASAIANIIKSKNAFLRQGNENISIEGLYKHLSSFTSNGFECFN